MDFLEKENLVAIIKAFKDNEYINPEDLLINKMVNCNEKELFRLLLKLERGKFIQLVKGKISESEYNLPILIRQTDKLRNEKKGLGL